MVKKKIISNLDLLIDKACRCTIIGPSGSGKSTILKLIVGLLKPDKGSVIIDGTDITTLTVNELTKSDEILVCCFNQLLYLIR